MSLEAGMLKLRHPAARQSPRSRQRLLVDFILPPFVSYVPLCFSRALLFPMSAAGRRG